MVREVTGPIVGDEVVRPVLAATVILVRDATPGLEVFLVRRHIKSDFASNAYVFPGGKIDESDQMAQEFVRIPSTNAQEPSLGWPAVFAGAIRETFEEAGILLAAHHSGAQIMLDCDGITEEEIDAWRSRIRTGENTLSDLCRTKGFTIHGDWLALFSNWVTPPIFSKRFDTYFFVGRVPQGQSARLSDERELTAGSWITPTEALRRAKEPDFPLVFATEKHLEQLGRFGSVNDIFAYCATCEVSPIHPRPIERDGTQAFLIPGDEGYDQV
jgi:8-oxo-dGTP pyrophosphatase MutT (NUDIX family)